MKIVKRKYMTLSVQQQQMWIHSVNMPFSKSLNRVKHHITLYGIISRRWTAADDVGRPSFCQPQDLIMRWSWNQGCSHFLSFIFSVSECSVFNFVVFYLWLWVNSDIRWWTAHIGSFRSPCLWSCPLSIDLKLSLSSLARHAISGHFDRRPNRLFQVRVRFDFKY